MNDPFDNIIKQARAIANPEQAVSKMNELEATNETLLKRAIHAEADAVCQRYEVKELKVIIEKLIAAGYAILREEGSKAEYDDAFVALADEWKAQK